MQTSIAPLIAKQFREVFFGGNWTVSNLKENLANVSWQQATAEVYSLNTISVLTYHIGYFVNALLMVLEGRPLDAHDKYSFDVPPISSQEDWNNIVKKVLTEAEQAAKLIEQLPRKAIGRLL